MSQSALDPPTVLALDDFGRVVAERVAWAVGIGDETTHSVGSLSDDDAILGRLVVIGRRLWGGRLADDDAVVQRQDAAWLPVSMEEPWIAIGPFTRAGIATTCLRCVVQRGLQHDMTREDTVALREEYGRGLTSPPAGFLPTHVDVAAALTLSVLHVQSGARGALDTAVGADEPRVIQVHVPSLTIAEWVVTPWDHCVTCCPNPVSDEIAAIVARLIKHG